MKAVEFAIVRKMITDEKFKDERVRERLELLLTIWALDDLLRDGTAAFDSGYLGAGSLQGLQAALEHVVRKLRPQFVSLAEIAHVDDCIRPSTIGNSYGDIYEWTMEAAKNSRMNKNEVPTYFKELMQPILRAKL